MKGVIAVQNAGRAVAVAALADCAQRCRIARHVVGRGVARIEEVGAKALEQQLAVEGEQPRLVAVVNLRQGGVAAAWRDFTQRNAELAASMARPP
jgi:hypothetical protein